MTLHTPLWMQATGDDPDIEYSALLDRSLTTWLVWSGGVARPAHLKVSQRSAGANMSVDVADGTAFIFGDDVTDQFHYVCWSDAVENLPVPDPPDTGSRTHRVVARVRDKLHNGDESTYDWVLEVLEDTGSGTPAEPDSALTLALVTVSAGQTSVTDAHITDRRVLAHVISPRLFEVTSDSGRPPVPTPSEKIWRSDKGYEEQWNGSAWVPIDGTPPVAILRRSSNQSIEREAPTAISFNSESLDSHNGHSTSSNPSRYVAPRSGVYRVSWTVPWEYFSGMKGRVESWVRRSDGVTFAGTTVYPSADGGTAGPVSGGSRLIQISEGSYIELYVWHDLVQHPSTLLAFVNVLASYRSGVSLDIEWLRPSS